MSDSTPSSLAPGLHKHKFKLHQVKVIPGADYRILIYNCWNNPFDISCPCVTSTRELYAKLIGPTDE